jgi:chemotaxis protein methyltransferase CheR
MGFLDFFSKDEPKEQSVESEVELDFSNFQIISDYIYKRSGIIDLDKRALVFTRLKQFAQESSIHTTTEFLQMMQNDNLFYQEVINIVTVNETYFFRELSELEWLVEHIKSSNSKFKILSLPSSSGEETYSILILLDMAGVDLNKIDIAGYDINSEAVSDAKDGYFNTHSLHKVDEAIKSKYFTKTDSGLYQVTQRLRDIPRFEQKNIFEISDERSSYDIVLSRNMFIYFDIEKRAEAVDIIVGLLKVGGIYIKGHADYIKAHPKLESIEFGIYKKIS